MFKWIETWGSIRFNGKRKWTNLLVLVKLNLTDDENIKNLTNSKVYVHQITHWRLLLNSPKMNIINSNKSHHFTHHQPSPTPRTVKFGQFRSEHYKHPSIGANRLQTGRLNFFTSLANLIEIVETQLNSVISRRLAYLSAWRPRISLITQDL